MKKVYYHIEENAYSYNSVGVICVENGVIPYDTIKEAIEEHLDEEIVLKEVVFNDYGYTLEIIFQRGLNDPLDDPFEDTMTAQRTTLYF